MSIKSIVTDDCIRVDGTVRNRSNGDGNVYSFHKHPIFNQIIKKKLILTLLKTVLITGETAVGTSAYGCCS